MKDIKSSIVQNSSNTLNSTINLDNIKYYIMDLSGKIIKTNILNSKSISLKELSTGFYILVLKSSEGEMVFNERIIKN